MTSPSTSGSRRARTAPDVWLKDEDELDAAVEGGRYTPEQGAAIRAIGEQARYELGHLRSWPLDEDWESYRPPPEWDEPLVLPDTPTVLEARPGLRVEAGADVVERRKLGSDVPGMNTTSEVLDWLEAQGHKMAALVDGLDYARLPATPLPSGWSMLGLLEHVRDSTHFWLHHALLGHPTELDEEDAWDNDPALSAAEVLAGFVASYTADVAVACELAADWRRAGGRRAHGAGTAKAPCSAC